MSIPTNQYQTCYELASSFGAYQALDKCWWQLDPWGQFHDAKLNVNSSQLKREFCLNLKKYGGKFQLKLSANPPGGILLWAFVSWNWPLFYKTITSKTSACLFLWREMLLPNPSSTSEALDVSWPELSRQVQARPEEQVIQRRIESLYSTSRNSYSIDNSRQFL